MSGFDTNKAFEHNDCRSAVWGESEDPRIFAPPIYVFAARTEFAVWVNHICGNQRQNGKQSLQLSLIRVILIAQAYCAVTVHKRNKAVRVHIQQAAVGNNGERIRTAVAKA